MFEYAKVDSETVQVQVTRAITAGQLLRINPSEAYLGVESGVVRVLAIIPAKPDNEWVYHSESYPESYPLIDTEDILRQVGEYKRIELDMYDHRDGSYYSDELKRLDSQPWVLYQYVRDGEWNVFPIEEFVDHSMSY